MNQITALCDKIIELKTGSYTDHIKDDYESIIKHMANKGCRSDVMSKVEDLYDLSNHAAKLARALKTSILELEKFSKYYADAVYYCPDESIECLKEIEEIFKWARREVEK